MLVGFTSETDVLNDVKIHLGLQPGTTNNVPLSQLNLTGDDYVIATRLNQMHRRMQSRGWHSFNLECRKTLPFIQDLISGQPLGFLVSNALWVKTTERMPADPCWPLAYGQPQADGSLRVFRRDTNSTLFEGTDATILFDICWNRPIANCPEPYLRWLAVATARSLGPQFGTAIHPNEELLAKDDFQRLESQMVPAANVFEDNTDILLTWSR